MSIRGNDQASLGDGRDPVEASGRNRRMEIVNLIGRDRRSLEQRESYMAERSLLGLARRKILARHKAEIGSRRAESKAVALVVGSHAGEAGTARNPPFEMKDVGEFHILFGRLIVVSILIEPGNREWTRAAVKRSRRNGRTAAVTGVERGRRPGNNGATGNCGAKLHKSPPGKLAALKGTVVFH